MWSIIRKKQQRKGEEGFTLIELIIVVAILGFLLAIAIPRYTTARANAALRASQANAKNIANAIELYMTEQNVTSPPTEDEINSTTDPVLADYLPQSPATPAGDDYHYLVSGDSYQIWDADYTGAEDGWFVQDGGLVIQAAPPPTGTDTDLRWGRP